MKIVVVDWIDVTKKMNDDDFDDKQSADDMVSSMKTIGWLYKETDKTILIVQEFDENTPRDWVVIPKVLITKKEETQ
jgi:hypothetical protein